MLLNLSLAIGSAGIVAAKSTTDQIAKNNRFVSKHLRFLNEDGPLPTGHDGVKTFLPVENQNGQKAEEQVTFDVGDAKALLRSRNFMEDVQDESMSKIDHDGNSKVPARLKNSNQGIEYEDSRIMDLDIGIHMQTAESMKPVSVDHPSRNRLSIRRRLKAGKGDRSTTKTPKDAKGSSASPSDIPSESPSVIPSHVPSETPSGTPSNIPSKSPSGLPSFVPSETPSGMPSETPSNIPSDIPSQSPSFLPSFVPSDSPSFVPSETPSGMPSETPSNIPSDFDDCGGGIFTDDLLGFWCNGVYNSGGWSF